MLLVLDDSGLREMADDLGRHVDVVVRSASGKADLESKEAAFAAAARKVIG